MNNKFVTTVICASAIALALTAPSRAQGVIAAHRLSAALAAEAVTEAVAPHAPSKATTSRQRSSIPMAWRRRHCAAMAPAWWRCLPPTIRPIR